MPVSKKQKDFRVRVAQLLDIPKEKVFLFPLQISRSGVVAPTLRIWLMGLSEEKEKAVAARKQEISDLCKTEGMKFSMSQEHPKEVQGREKRRRRRRRRRSQTRKGERISVAEKSHLRMS